MFQVSLHVPTKLWDPVLGPSARKPSFPALCMLMPEAAMNENHTFQPSKHHIRRTRKVLSVEPIPITQ
jgi:hypothetical protein